MAQVTNPQFDKLRKAIDVLRLFDREIPAQVISTFFYIASHDGCTGNDVSKALNMTASSISRCTDWLSDYHRLGKPGMGLIVKKQNNIDLRTRQLFLTPKGRSVVDQLSEILNG